MQTPKKPLSKVPPFIEKKTDPSHKNGVDTRGMVSLATMLVSLAALSVSMFGAARLVMDIFQDGLDDANNSSLEGLMVKIVVLGFSFLFGWIVGLVSIRGFGNLVYPIIIKIYAWGCLAAIGYLYIKVILKLYMQKYNWAHFWAYFFILLGSIFVLICLHLLIEEHDLRPFAIPPLIISVVHLCVIVYRYVFIDNPNGLKLPGDLTIFLMMISISGLMLLHMGLLSPLRHQISALFNNGNGIS